jgi:hypothetical protein
MRREEVYRNDNFPIGRASRWRTAALPPCGIDGLRSLWACRIRRKVAHPIKRTQRQQGLTRRTSNSAGGANATRLIEEVLG